jgi:hypothetical protein
MNHMRSGCVLPTSVETVRYTTIRPRGVKNAECGTPEAVEVWTEECRPPGYRASFFFFFWMNFYSGAVN